MGKNSRGKDKQPVNQLGPAEEQKVPAKEYEDDEESDGSVASKKLSYNRKKGPNSIKKQLPAKKAQKQEIGMLEEPRTDLQRQRRK
jgi:hypothetical protein